MTITFGLIGLRFKAPCLGLSFQLETDRVAPNIEQLTGFINL